MNTVVLLVVIVVAILRLLPRRRDFLTTCEALVRQMPPNQYERLSDLIPEESRTDDQLFWCGSEGVAGQLSRLRTSLIYTRLIQAHFRDGRIDKHDAGFIWRRFALQVWFTLLALPESALCHFVGTAPHIAARASLRFYCDLVLRTNGLCVTRDAPECLMRLPDLL